MDYHLFQLINQRAGIYGWLDFLMVAMTAYGPYLFAAVFAALLISRKHRSGGILVGGTLGLALLMSFIIGQLWDRARPFVTYDDVTLLLYHAPDASFPSDHTTGAFAIAIALWHYHKTFGSVMLVLAFLIGISRPFVGHHYPGDVLAGIAVAWVAAQLVRYMMKRLPNRSAKETEVAS